MDRTPTPAIRAALPLAALLLFSFAAAAQPAPPPPPGGAQDRARRAAAEALAAAAGPEAFDALLRFDALEDYLTRTEYRSLLAPILAARNPDPSVRLLAGYLEANRVLADEGPAAAEAAFAGLGFVREWRVVGPFDNEGRAGLTTEYPPEAEQLDPEILAHTYDGKERTVGWMRTGTPYAGVRLDRVVYPVSNTCGYAYAVARLPRPADARIWAGSDGALTLWVGGRRAVRDEHYLSSRPDRFAADLRLPAGEVPLLAKVCGDSGSMVLYVRLTDRAGRPLPGIAFTAPEAAPAAPTALTEDPVPAQTAMDVLVARAEEGTAADRLTAGRVLQLTGTVDRTDNDAQRLLERAAEEAPSAELFYWLAAATTDAIKSGIATARLAALVGDDPFLLAAAAARRSGTVGPAAAEWPARRAMELPAGADDPYVVVIRASLLAGRGLSGACTALLDRWLADHPAVPAVLSQLESCLSAEGRGEEALAIQERRADADRSDTGLLLARQGRAAAVKDAETVRALADALVAAFPHRLNVLLDVARNLHTAGDGDRAVELLRRLAAESPLHPRVVESLGATLEALGRRDEAVEAYRRVVELEPQNQPIVKYLEFLDDAVGIEQRWAVELEDLAPLPDEARRSLAALSPAERDRLRRGRELLRQEVDVIHANGLSSRFGQTFSLVQTEDGAEQARQTTVPYTPGEEDFELLRALVHKPDGTTRDYEVHYPVSYGGSSFFSDAGAELIAFPRLAVGDILEIRYRIDGRSRQNKFGEHFSREVGILALNPTDRFRYALVAPEAKRLYVRLPDRMDVQVAEETSDGETVRTYAIDDLPGIAEEPNAPPGRELVQAIQISTFADWPTLARWWWNLIREQLQPDETIRTRVAEIVAGVAGDEEKAHRIFDWVIRNTRYVAMEFGIHGWKPYRAHEVVSRGFGDCKDKSGLIYTMLAAAGIESRLLLLRTRYYSGRPLSDFPSLGQFDHVIVYVPSLDLYLDGTVTQAGPLDLPVMDRQAFGLLVGPDEERVMTTPLAPRGPEELAMEAGLALEPDGSAALEATLTATGHYAMGLRGRYEAEETRRERLEEALNGMYAGLELGDHTVENLDRFPEPVAIRLDARVPNAAARSGSGFSLPAARPLHLARTYAAAATRELEVELYGPVSQRQTLRYRLPAGAVEIRLPRAAEATDGDRRFRLEVRQDGLEVVVDYEIRIPDSRIPREAYAGFRAFCAAVDTALAEPITYELP